MSNWFFATIIYYAEIDHSNINPDENGLVNSFGDALWLSSETLTTVGYGDFYPHTILGKSVVGVVAIIGNSVILALPISIVNLKF